MGLRDILILISLLISSVEVQHQKKCLTGYMTDVQDWVDEYGHLRVAEIEMAMDLSEMVNPLSLLQEKISMLKPSNNKVIKYLSLARCQLTRVPPVFHVIDANGRFLYEMVEFVTFYGNVFLEKSAAGEHYIEILNATGVIDTRVGTIKEESVSLWSSGLRHTRFPHLKQLDLRACAIKVLNRNLFVGMPELEALYLGENNVFYINSDAFTGLSNLVHLDLSRNAAYDERGVVMQMVIEDFRIFEDLKNLTSLDLSHTKITQRNLAALKGLGKNMQRLSLCQTELTSLPSGIFNKTSIRILDLSYNSGILSQSRALDGIQNTLQFFYAVDVDLTSMGLFEHFHKLEILKLNYNHITSFPRSIAKTLQSLQILDLSFNRLTTWFEPRFSHLPELKFLSIIHNNINLLSEEMLEDFEEINYLAISGNFLVCNCESRAFLQQAAKNENCFNSAPPISTLNNFGADRVTSYHKGFKEYNKHIMNRKKVVLDDVDGYSAIGNFSTEGIFLLIDYSPMSYTCLSPRRSKVVTFTDITECVSVKNVNYDEVVKDGRRLLLILLIIPLIMLPVLIGFIFRRNFRYFLIMVKNSAMLSLINNKESADDEIIYHYDVFVSYCNEDRGWVLDHLLPHLDTDCNVSACLHERDFQVGLSILENIVACMDRSRAIMLIISQKFLKSQWCQFEMHLAQHRLLETRREDLTLVLLEEIPRRIRPNTLHYLMLTKTYIVWPKEKSERDLFWRRLNKSFMTQKLRYKPRDSTA